MLSTSSLLTSADLSVFEDSGTRLTGLFSGPEPAIYLSNDNIYPNDPSSPWFPHPQCSSHSLYPGVTTWFAIISGECTSKSTFIPTTPTTTLFTKPLSIKVLYPLYFLHSFPTKLIIYSFYFNDTIWCLSVFSLHLEGRTTDVSETAAHLRLPQSSRAWLERVSPQVRLISS